MYFLGFRMGLPSGKCFAFLVAIVAITGIAAVPNAQARKGFWFGAGGAQQSAGGDLDGQQQHVYLNSTQTEAAVPGKLDTGSGTEFDFGYGVNDYVGAEALIAATTHNATNSYLSPKLDTTAALVSIMGGLRFTLPSRNKGAELFFRTMLGAYGVAYQDYAVSGAVAGNQFAYTSTGTATFSGTGGAIGIGAEVFLGNFGLSLGYTYSAASFSSVSGTGSNNSSYTANLSKALSVPITTIDLLLTYHVPEGSSGT